MIFLKVDNATPDDVHFAFVFLIIMIIGIGVSKVYDSIRVARMRLAAIAWITQHEHDEAAVLPDVEPPDRCETCAGTGLESMPDESELASDYPGLCVQCSGTGVAA